MTFLDARRRASGILRPGRFSILVCLLFCAAAPTAQAALTISASTLVSPARQSEYLDVEITVANTSAFSRSSVVVEMIYPPNLNQLFETEFDGDCLSTTCNTGEVVTWDIGTVAAGAAVTVTLPAQVTNIAPDGAAISFAPTVTDSLLDTDTTTLDVEVQTDSIYDLSLSENADPAIAGALLTYKLSYGYRADATTVSNSTLRFPIPANSTFVSATGGGVFGSGNVDWSLGFLSPGDGGVREVTVQLDGGLAAGDIIAASAEIFAVSTPTEGASSLANTAIAASRGLQLSIESNTNPARPNEILNLQLTVANTDPFAHFGVVLTGRYPQDVNQFFESEFDGNCSSTSCNSGERIVWTVGDIPAGQSVTVDISPQIASNATTGVLINLTARAKDSAGLESRQTDTIRIQGDSIYDLSLSENSDPALAGSALTYKLTYGYRQDAASVNNSILRLPLPAGTTFASATDGGTLNSGVVEWPLGPLSPGDGGVREATLMLGGGLTAATVIQAAAEVTSLTAAAEVSRAEANTAIASSRGLQLAIEGNANPARDQEILTLLITVTNHDAFPRFGVRIAGVFPQDLNQLFRSEFDGICSSTSCNPGERLAWNLGDIGAGQTKTVTMAPTITNIVQGGTLINFFMAAEDDQGLQTHQMDTIRVQTDSIYDLALAAISDPATAGSMQTYKLSYGYRSDAATVNNSILRLPLPVGATFVSATGGGVLNSGAIEWPLGFLSPGDGGVRQAMLSLDGGLASGTVIEAAAEVSSLSSPVERARAEANSVIAATESLQLAMETIPDPARPGELTNYRMTVSNNDAFPRFGVVLTGVYPQWLNQEFESEFDGDCSSTSCNAGERVTWMLGDIPAGETKTVDLPPIVASNVTGGVLINFYASAQDDQGVQTRQMDMLVTQSDTVYDVAVTDSSDPATPGSLLTYKLTYGYRDDAGSVSDSLLRLQIPNGATFVSATGGGVHSSGNVDWALGFLSPGDGGIVEATVMLDGGLPSGAILEAAADLFGVASPDEGARAEANTAIRNTVSLSLDVDALVFTAAAARRLNTQLTVTNNDAFTRFGVALKGRFPQDLNQLFESDPDFTGNCSSTSCNAGEVIAWPLVDIPAGQSVTLTLPPTVAAPFVEGRLINFLAWVEDDQGVEARGAESVYSGCIASLDNDCDGIRDSIDNCLAVANTNQRDTDGDNIGNACDPDVFGVNDCLVNFLDLNVYRANFFQSGDLDTDNNGDGLTNFLDLNVIRALFFQQPGPSASGCN